jgi:hypothetical protein
MRCSHKADKAVQLRFSLHAAAVVTTAATLQGGRLILGHSWRTHGRTLACAEMDGSSKLPPPAFIALWCNGSTKDSESLDVGSTPTGATNLSRKVSRIERRSNG